MDSQAGSEIFQPGRLQRDGQQWHFDRMIQDTGRVFHYQLPGRGPLPESVRMHQMISKHVGKIALRLQTLAAEEAAADHNATALDLYFEAACRFAEAQHTILRNNAEKEFLHASSIACFDEVRRRAPYVIHHVDVPWNGTQVSGNLHLAPVKSPAPCVFLIPGCDMTKEMVPHPHFNYAAQRGMHLFVFDGPGQGESNLRNISLTIDNYESAASAALSYLRNLPEVDAQRVGLLAMSFGSYWGVRFAGTDKRISAVALPAASVGDPYHLMEEESPRYKQLFMYLTRSSSEGELDEFIGNMDLRPFAEQIVCPVLLTVGEYDPRSPLEEVYDFFDRIRTKKELWVHADQHHMPSLQGIGGTRTLWHRDIYATSLDWLRDRLDGREMRNEGETVYLDGSAGPSGKEAPRKRWWFE